MKLLRLEINSDFRSLKAGFELQFRDKSNLELMQAFRPFCFAGLNGSGKSNVLEALANIFYHLDMCANRYKPYAFEKFFDPRTNINGPNAFELEYITFSLSERGIEDGYNLIRIIKEEDDVPKMYQIYHLYEENDNYTPTLNEVNLVAEMDQDSAAEGKSFLPELVIGYSSGENEILSIPFIKSRLIHLDQYVETPLGLTDSEGIQFEGTESSLTYIDSEMSQAVLLTCLLFEDEETTLKPIFRELELKQLTSFRMHLNDIPISVLWDNYHAYYPALTYVSEKIDQLKNIATCWYEEIKSRKVNRDHDMFYEEKDNVKEIEVSVLRFDFFVDVAMKEAFRDMFNNSSIEMFQFFQLLYELNNSFLEPVSSLGGLREEVYKSSGFYTDGKLPIPGPNDKVFYFENFYLEKYIDTNQSKTVELLLRNFSDGEHQFIHTMGICLLLKTRRTIMLLDEPETHFNPSWRAKFISLLSESLDAGGANHLQKDVLITSHSPFIISDCLPNNVFLFKKSRDTNKVLVKSARELDVRTYGTSVEIILDELFEYDQSIGDLSFNELKNINYEGIRNPEDVKEIKRSLRHLGESIEKDLTFAKLNSMFPDDEGNSNANDDGPSPDILVDGPESPINYSDNPNNEPLNA